MVASYLPRFITKHFFYNYEKLIKMDSVIDIHNRSAFRKHPMGNVDYLKTPISDFGWMTYLDEDNFNQLKNEWNSAFWDAETIKDQTQIIHITQELKDQLFFHHDKDKNKKMWGELQETKYKFQAIASTNKGGIIVSIKKRFNDLKAYINSVEDSVMQPESVSTPGSYVNHSRSQEAIMYVAYLSEYSRTYERAQQHGAENDLQKEVLFNIGLFRCVQYAVSTGKSLVSVIHGDLSSIKTLAKSVVRLVDTAGGIISGIADTTNGKEADYRRLSAQYGWDKEANEQYVRAVKKVSNGLGINYVENKRFNVDIDLEKNPNMSKAAKDNLMDQTGALSKQTPIEMSQQVSRTDLEIENDRNEIRHSLFWVNVFERDLQVLESDLKKNDTSNVRNVLMRELQLNIQRFADTERQEDSDSILPSQINSLQTEATATMDEAFKKLAPQIESLKSRLHGFKDLLVQAIRNLDELTAAADTRRGIVDAQFKLAGEGIRPTMPQLIASAAATSALNRAERLIPNSPILNLQSPLDSSMSAMIEKLKARRIAIAGNEDEDEDEGDFDF